MATRRSTRSVSTPLANDEIFFRADVLGTAQWRALDMSPRTGWVRGVLAPRRQQATVAAVLRAAHSEGVDFPLGFCGDNFFFGLPHY
jgi:hypothetical protein